MTTQVINKTNFKGLLALSISNADLEDFNAVVLDVQNDTAIDLLGDELYNAFSTDLDAGSGTPTETKWLHFLNGTTWIEVINENDTTQDITHNSIGIKEVWKYFTYYQWLNQAPFVSNFIGKSVHNTENSTPLDRQSLNIETQNRYNKGIDIYKKVSKFINYFAEIEQDYTSISEVAGTYTVNLTSTKYLSNGDEVEIDGIRYTVANLVADTSFQFTATTGLTFSDDYVVWFPFEDGVKCDRNKIYFNGLC